MSAKFINFGPIVGKTRSIENFSPQPVKKVENIEKEIVIEKIAEKEMETIVQPARFFEQKNSTFINN